MFARLGRFLSDRYASVENAVQTLLAVHSDRAQLALRRQFQLGLKAAIVALAVGTATIVATIELVSGVNRGLALLLGGREWLGSILAGLLFLALVGAGTALAFRRWNRVQLTKQEAKYARLRKRRAGDRESRPRA